MSAAIEEQLEKIPVINWVVRLLKKIKLKAFEGLSFYDLIEMYLVGIVKGTLSSRASSIAFSIFLALFPLLIFLVTMVPFIIPYVSVGNENFDAQFLDFLESFLRQQVITLVRFISRSKIKNKEVYCLLHLSCPSF